MSGEFTVLNCHTHTPCGFIYRSINSRSIHQINKIQHMTVGWRKLPNSFLLLLLFLLLVSIESNLDKFAFFNNPIWWCRGGDGGGDVRVDIVAVVVVVVFKTYFTLQGEFEIKFFIWFRPTKHMATNVTRVPPNIFTQTRTIINIMDGWMDGWMNEWMKHILDVKLKHYYIHTYRMDGLTRMM